MQIIMKGKRIFKDDWRSFNKEIYSYNYNSKDIWIDEYHSLRFYDPTFNNFYFILDKKLEHILQHLSRLYA